MPIDVTGEETAADGAGAAMPAFCAVGSITTGERPAADDTFETAALGDADDIDEITDGKDRGSNDIAGLHFLGEVAEFLDLLDRARVELLEVAELRFGDALLLLVNQTELDSVIAIAVGGLALDDSVGTGENDGNRGHHAIGVIDARMAEFFS